MLFNIPLRDGGTKAVKLVWQSKDSILAVHIHLAGVGYAITHLKTGIRVTSQDTKKEAIAMAKRLLRECPPSTWVFISEAESVKSIRAVILNDSPVCQKAKAYEEKLIKTDLTKTISV